jgi:two-component system sensor histidine kinase UhpB
MVLLAANRHGEHLADFAIAAWAWAAALSPAWWTTLPLRPLWLDLLVASLMGPALAFGVKFLMRFANQDLPRLRTLLSAQCLLLPLSLALVAPDARAATASVWMALLGLELAAALGIYLGLCWREKREDAWAMGGILVLVGGVFVLEAVALPDGLGRHGVAWVVGSPFGFGVLLIAVGVQLLNLFSRALVSAEASRQSLETRVQEITVQIENNFAQLSEMRVEQLTQKERKRIAADLHDDLGAKLLTIVHTCDNERIAALGREALDDMRLSVRGLNGKPMRLADAMADWRAETVQRLGQTNIQVEWHAPNDEVDYVMG